MFFIEDQNFLNDQQKSFVDESLLNEKMSFKLATHAVKFNDKGYHLINHIKRPEDIDGNKSEYYWPFVDIVKSFCSKHKIEINKIFRMAVNVTFNNGFVDKCPIHTDHNYNHKQLILYLNDAVGDTVICDNDNKPVIVSQPKKYKAICFGKIPHYQYFPIFGVRCVLVVTFE